MDTYQELKKIDFVERIYQQHMLKKLTESISENLILCRYNSGLVKYFNFHLGSV